MTDLETQQRFILLRSEGWSFARIAAELKISKPTLINWSRKFQYQIQNLRAIALEELQEKWLASHSNRIAALGERLRKIEDELQKRDLSSVSTSGLYALAYSLRRQLQREIGPMQFSNSIKDIPPDEYHDQAQDWHP
jgi:transposase